MKILVSDLLDVKGAKVVTIDPDATIYDSVKTLMRHNIGALLVEEEGQPLGILSERDCRRMILDDKNPHKVTVRELKSTVKRTVAPDDSLEDCMLMMTEHRIRHLPVVSKGKLAGIVSIGDVVKKLYEERSREVENLEKYITGSL